jgi:hypothetical protein
MSRRSNNIRDIREGEVLKEKTLSSTQLFTAFSSRSPSFLSPSTWYTSSLASFYIVWIPPSTKVKSHFLWFSGFEIHFHSPASSTWILCPSPWSRVGKCVFFTSDLASLIDFLSVVRLCTFQSFLDRRGSNPIISVTINSTELQEADLLSLSFYNQWTGESSISRVPEGFRPLVTLD